MKLFRRKITPEYVRKYFQDTGKGLFESHKIGYIGDSTDELLIEIRDNNQICLSRGYNYYSSYWICDIEYIYQLKQMLKIYKIL